MNGEVTPLAAHLPFYLSDDDKTVELIFYVQTPNRATRGGAAPAKLMITGPHGYISPD